VIGKVAIRKEPKKDWFLSPFNSSKQINADLRAELDILSLADALILTLATPPTGNQAENEDGVVRGMDSGGLANQVLLLGLKWHGEVQ